MNFKLAIMGKSGKMGKTVLTCVEKTPLFTLISEGEVPDVYIDFTLAEAFSKNLAKALQEKVPFVSGTTGLSAKERSEMDEASQHIPIFYSENFSVGMALLERLAAEAAAAFPTASIDIFDTHHIHKKDAPSGSALRLQKNLPRNAVMHSIRAGEVIGEHSVQLHTPQEKFTLTHNAFSRKAFAEGALVAAEFLLKKEKGLFSMKDLLS